jgi:LuxR family transcriptional regulator, maltose regulon positive regulatory protein
MARHAATWGALRVFEARTGTYVPAARLHPIACVPGTVDRPRLDGYRDAVCSVAATVVRAPAGYGKTTLLGQWYSQLSHSARVVWLTLDPAARVPGIFLARVVAALTKAEVSQDSEIRDWLNGRVHRSETTLAQRIADGAGRLGPTVLFLDDVHHLTGSPSAACVKSLIECARGFHVVLATRGESDIELARLRAAGQLSELDERDLAFTPEEVTRLFAGECPAEMTSSQIEAITAHTGGWACGLSLLLKTWQETHGRPRRQWIGMGSHLRPLRDFFAEEVFQLQDSVTQEFLLKTSILGDLSAPLCDAVTGRTDGAQMLQSCVRKGLFISRSDSSPGWFRYQALFAEFLADAASALPASELAALHGRASVWLLENGHAIEACTHAMEAGDMDHAARLLDASCEVLFSSWRLLRVPQLAARVPERIRAQYPRLMLAAACQLAIEWRVDEAEALLGATRTRLEELVALGNIGERELRSLRGTLLHREAIVAQMRDRPRLAEQLCEKLLREHSDLPSCLKGHSYTQLINARRYQFMLSEVDRLDALARQHSIGTDSPLVMFVHDCVVGVTLQMAGRTDAAVSRLRNALGAAARVHGRGSAAGAIAALPLAEIHFERNEIEWARKLIADYLPISRDGGLRDKLVSGWLTHARLTQLDRGDAAAIRVLEEADMIASQRGFRRMRLILCAERIKWLVRLGSTREAEALAREIELPRDPARVLPCRRSTLQEEAEALAWVRLAQAHNRVTEALHVAKQWRSHLATHGARGHLAQWDILLVQQYLLQGQECAATRSLRSALCSAAPGRLIRPFLDEGPALTSLILHYAQSQSSSGDAAEALASLLAAELQSGAPRGAACEQGIVSAHLAGALSQTEIRVLTMAGAGMRNCDVGARLGMTEGSVKWCLQQIYDKIGVRKRSQAVDRARRLGIIA